MKISDDQSIFAWGLPEHSTTADEFVKCYTFPAVSELRGMFADAPSDFTFTHRIKVLENILSSMPPIVSNNRVEVELQVARWKENPLQVVALFCTTITDFRWFIWTPLLPWGKRWSARFAELVLIYPHSLMGGNLESSYGELSVCLISQLPKTYEISGPFQIIARTNLLIKDFYSFDEVKYAPRAICIPETKATTVMPSPELCVDSIHTVLFFKAHAHDNNLLRLLRYFSSTSVTKYKLEKYTFAVAGFAILIGGAAIQPWSDCVLFLDNGSGEAIFASLGKECNGAIALQRSMSKAAFMSQVRQGKRIFDGQNDSADSIP